MKEKSKARDRESPAEVGKGCLVFLLVLLAAYSLPALALVPFVRVQEERRVDAGGAEVRKSVRIWGWDMAWARMAVARDDAVGLPCYASCSTSSIFWAHADCEVLQEAMRARRAGAAAPRDVDCGCWADFECKLDFGAGPFRRAQGGTVRVSLPPPANGDAP